MNEIQTDRLDAILRRTLAIRAGSLAPTLGPEILPVIVLENDRPEWRYYERERLYMCTGVQAAVLAEYACVGIKVTAPGHQIIVERMYVTSAAVGKTKICMAPTAGFVGWSLPHPRDDRTATTEQFGARAHVLSTAASVSGGMVISHAASDTKEIVGPWILSYGDRILFAQRVAANQDLDASFVFRDRMLEQGEQP